MKNLLNWSMSFFEFLTKNVLMTRFFCFFVGLYSSVYMVDCCQNIFYFCLQILKYFPLRTLLDYSEEVFEADLQLHKIADLRSRSHVCPPILSDTFQQLWNFQVKFDCQQWQVLWSQLKKNLLSPTSINSQFRESWEVPDCSFLLAPCVRFGCPGTSEKMKFRFSYNVNELLDRYVCLVLPINMFLFLFLTEFMLVMVAICVGYVQTDLCSSTLCTTRLWIQKISNTWRI